MTAKMRCVMCGARFDGGSASQRVADFNRHTCEPLQPATRAESARIVLALIAIVVVLMVFNWLADVLAGQGWLTPVAIVGTLIFGLLIAFKINTGD